MTIRIKDWAKFQHFKDRSPPWVKLYRDILDDIEWHELEPKAAKALVMLWLIASENAGELPDIKKLAFRLRTSQEDVANIISKLSHWLEHDDIAAISPTHHPVPTGDIASIALARSRETETETEGEKETEGEETRGAVAPPPPPTPRPQPPAVPTPAPKPPPPAAKPAPAGRSKRVPMPEGFDVSARVTAWAVTKGFDRLPDHMDAFRRKARMNAYTYVDWDDAFMEAVREDWAKLRGRALNGAAPPPDVQPPRGPDPALLKIEADRLLAAPIPPHILALRDQLRGNGVHP